MILFIGMFTRSIVFASAYIRHCWQVLRKPLQKHSHTEYPTRQITPALHQLRYLLTSIMEPRHAQRGNQQ